MRRCTFPERGNFVIAFFLGAGGNTTRLGEFWMDIYPGSGVSFGASSLSRRRWGRTSDPCSNREIQNLENHGHSHDLSLKGGNSCISLRRK